MAFSYFLQGSEQGKSSDTPPPHDLWSALAVRAQGGDKRAYTTLLRDITPLIRKVLAPSLANPDWVDEVAQIILMSVHKALHTYDPKRPFRPWLMAIIKFRRTDFLRSHYRKANRESSLDALEGDHYDILSVTSMGDAGESKDIEAALSKLSKKQKATLLMMKVQGYSAREVADAMGMSVSAVKVAVHRAVRALKADGLGDG